MSVPAMPVGRAAEVPFRDAHAPDLPAERERLRAEVQRHAGARRAYETKRAELSAALGRVGRGPS